MNLSLSLLLAQLLILISLQSTVSFTPRQLVRAGTNSFKSINTAVHSTKVADKLGVSAGPTNGIHLLGTGSSTPETYISNTDLEAVVETSDEWIKSRTGIGGRRVLLHEGKETLSSLGTESGRQALEMSKVDPLDVDMVINCCSSPDDIFGDATTISSSLGCHNAVAFDLTAACSGFLFGIVTATNFMSSPATSPRPVRNVLVVGSDALSRWVDWTDRNSCILFGDGSGAMVMSNDPNYTDQQESTGVMGYSMHSDGRGHGELKCETESQPVPVATPGDGLELSKGGYSPITMNGKKVYAFATREVPTVLEEAMETASLKVEDIDHLLLHQANIRIMETVAKRLGVPMEKVVTNLVKYGNTSAGSIPIALDEAVREGKIKKGDVIAAAGFGAGLSWGGAILKWSGPK
mmetsp:Transcript_13075/g.26689  ORF Transcript_13075/g.26689 Transcript_13075/m.26689 type:complete len:407 (-) Transcript_13075:74-1294(-)|eukprot:CAMPEP_0118644282 /NCGR_PEP_ID=MMETSP0785-20121206/6860_1 /TAXON_ID=91992 /ORGANISM="Bolidomonas pacifica, Strain CCMP 1866" /LENGTH=406 /DNA_ID=CAMNT_0006536039 /DNA_START=153 /DNA_END=1373 /DNA_ORIENTATION=-